MCVMNSLIFSMISRLLWNFLVWKLVMVSTRKIFLIFRFIDIFGFTWSFNFVSTTKDNKKDGAAWNGVIRDSIDNEKLNSEIVNSINGFRVTSNNNSGNDSSGFNIHNNSKYYDSSDNEWLQKQYKRYLSFLLRKLNFFFFFLAFEVIKKTWNTSKGTS